MKRYSIRILNEEYKVQVCIGTRAELIAAGARFCEESKRDFARGFEGKRGQMLYLKNKGPMILVDGDADADQAIATLAHEASHAIESIEKFLDIRDSNDEFRAHGIGAIMRAVTKDLLPDKRKTKRGTNS